MAVSAVVMAAFLGVVEGVTEFLPVSSTGHLILVEDLLGFEGPPGKLFEIVIQLGAILSVCWLYRNKLLEILRTLFQSPRARHFAINITLAFLPAMVLITVIVFALYIINTSLEGVFNPRLRK